MYIFIRPQGGGRRGAGTVRPLLEPHPRLAHNFDSPHTHCYGGVGGEAQPVDQCSASECGQAGCFCGTPSLPCATTGAGCGTVMSYCHLLTGNLANITFTFGEGHRWGVQPQRVPQRMRSHVAARAQTNPACLALSPNEPVCEDLVLSDLTVSTAQSVSTCGTLFRRPQRARHRQLRADAHRRPRGAAQRLLGGAGRAVEGGTQ